MHAVEAKELLKQLRKEDINVSLSGNNLQIKCNTAEIPPALYEAIKKNKQEIIEYLRGAFFNETDHVPIPVTSVQPCYPLSASQLRLWMLCQFEEANLAYNMPGLYVFDGDFNKAALEKAFASLMERHEILRTVFGEDESGEVRQFIRSTDDTGFSIEYRDMSFAAIDEVEINGLIQEIYNRPFDLGAGPLIRASILQIQNNKFIFVYIMHHIISDGWSMGVLFNELLHFYNHHLTATGGLLTSLRIQYKDYAAWQHELLSGARTSEARQYWVKQFEGELPVLNFPGTRVRPAVKSYAGGSVHLKINAKLSDDLRLLVQEQGATLFMGLLAVVNALLYEYTGLDDIIIGTPIAGREHADLHDQLGFYANTIALRTKFKGTDSYTQLLDTVKQVTMGAYAHQGYPFDSLVEELKLDRDMSRNPLFDIQVVLQGNEALGRQQANPGGLEVYTYGGKIRVKSIFDLVFYFIETDQEIETILIYNSNLFDKSTIDTLARHLEQMIEALVAAPHRQLMQLDYLTTAEKNQMLVEFNDTSMPFSGGKTMVDLFEDQVKKTPGGIAVVSEGKSFTYKELDEASGLLANHLRRKYGVKANDLIGIMLDRSALTVVAMLGVLKSGAAYVPIDSQYPADRKRYIIEDTAINVLIAGSNYISGLEYYSGSILAVEEPLSATDNAIEPQKVNINPADLAYVIYTSGSTGEPKGVMIEHRAIVNTIYAEQNIFELNEGDRGLQFASMSFDASVWEICMILTTGGALYVISEDDKKYPRQVEQYIINNGLSVATLPPAFLTLMDIKKMQSLRKLITAGESAILDDAYAFNSYGMYYNAYGPTETSICATVFKFHISSSLRTVNVPIGRPIPNTRIYIVNEHNRLLPLGVMGEICISGNGLARGYLNKPAATAQKFVPNPFVEGTRMYKTGDLGRWLPDGNVEFLGRKDDQVKINGYRIELEEIECALQTHIDIDSAAVAVSVDAYNDKVLVAYLVTKTALTAQDIRSYLGKLLPHYLLPGRYVQLQEMPLTSNGKINKKNLPYQKGTDMDPGVVYLAPRNEIEEKLVSIWQKVLGKAKIGITDNFFEAGGTSIKIVKLSRLINTELGKDISVGVLFQYPNIEEFMGYLMKAPDSMEEEAIDSNQLMSGLEKFNA